MIINELLVFLIIEIITLLLFIYTVIKNIKLQHKINDQFISSSEQKLEGFLNHIHHLNNVISGINHELQPLVGVLNNKLALIERRIELCVQRYNKTSSPYTSLLCEQNNEHCQFCLRKIQESQAVIKTILETLKNLSRDIKHIQEYNLVYSNLAHSIVSWVYVVLNDLTMKNFIQHKNIFVDEESLNFSCWHSPMFVSQIILNLIKNSIEHNPEKEDLHITIYGDKKTSSLIYCDNGKGIPKHLLTKIFTPGFSTKNNATKISGLGLALCKDYCASMKASISALECETGAMFIITFLSKKING